MVPLADGSVLGKCQILILTTRELSAILPLSGLGRVARNPAILIERLWRFPQPDFGGV
jgi:hypothetical protein